MGSRRLLKCVIRDLFGIMMGVGSGTSLGGTSEDEVGEREIGVTSRRKITNV